MSSSYLGSKLIPNKSGYRYAGAPSSVSQLTLPSPTARFDPKAPPVLERLKLEATLGEQHRRALTSELKTGGAVVDSLQSKVRELTALVGDQCFSIADLERRLGDAAGRMQAQGATAAATVAAIRQEATATAAAYAVRAVELERKVVAAELAASAAATTSTAASASAARGQRAAEARAVAADAARMAAVDTVRSAQAENTKLRTELQAVQAASGAALHHLRISEESEAGTRAAAQAALAQRAAELTSKDGCIARLEAELGDAIAALSSLPVHASLPPSSAATGPSSKLGGGAEVAGVGLAAPLGLQVSAATGRADLSRARVSSSFKALTPKPAPSSSASLALLPPFAASSATFPGQVGGGSYVVRPLAGSTPSSCSSPGSDRSEKESVGWRGLDSRDSVSRKAEARSEEVAAVEPQQQQQEQQQLRPRSLGDLRSWYALQLRHERAEHEGELRKERQRGAAAAAGAAARLATLRADHTAALNSAAEAHSAQVRALKAEAVTLEAETVAAVQARLDASEARAASLGLALQDVRYAAAAADSGCVTARAGLAAAEERLTEWAASTRELAERAAKAEAHAATLEVQAVAARATIAEAEAAHSRINARLADLETRVADTSDSMQTIADAEASLEALNREATVLRAASADSDSLRVRNGLLQAANEDLERSVAVSAAASKRHAADVKAAVAEAEQADAAGTEWLRAALSVAHASAVAAEAEVRRLSDALDSSETMHAMALVALGAESTAALSEAAARHDSALQRASAELEASRAAASQAVAELHSAQAAASAASEASLATLREGIERQERRVADADAALAAGSSRELAMRTELAAALVALVDALAARDAATAASAAAKRVADEAASARAAEGAMKRWEDVQASHADQVRTISLRCAEAEESVDELTRELRAAVKQASSAEAANRALKVAAAASLTAAGDAAAIAVRDHAGARANLATARQQSTHFREEARDAVASASRAASQLAEAHAREAHSEARASVLQRRSMVAAATSSASQAALAEGVAWAAAVAEALQAHLAALREAEAGSLLVQRHASCQRTLATLEALLSAAGLQVGGRSATHQQGPRNPPAALTATVPPDPATGVTTGAYGSEFSPLSTPNAGSVAQPSSLSLGVAEAQHEAAATTAAPASSFHISPLAGDCAPQAAPSKARASTVAVRGRGDTGTRRRAPASRRSSETSRSAGAAAATLDLASSGDVATRQLTAQAASHVTTPPKPPPVIPTPNPFQSPPASAARSLAMASPTSCASAAASGRRVRFRSDPRAAARDPLGSAPPRLPDLSLYVSPPSPDMAHGAAAAWLARRRLLGTHA